MDNIQFFIDGTIEWKGKNIVRIRGSDGRIYISTKQIDDVFDKKIKVINQTISRNHQYFRDLIIDVRNNSCSYLLLLKKLRYTKMSIAKSKYIYLLSHEGFILYLQIADINEDYSEFEKKYFNSIKSLAINPIRYEKSFGIILKGVLNSIVKVIIPQYSCYNNQYYIDFYIPELNLAIEYDEENHKYYQTEDEQREIDIHKELGCDFIRVKKGKELEGINEIMKYIINKNIKQKEKEKA